MPKDYPPYDDVLAEVVRLMRDKPETWGDADLAISMLAERKRNPRQKSISSMGDKPGDVENALELYRRLFSLPWKSESLPKAYKSTAIPKLPGLSIRNMIAAYVDPKRQELYMGAPGADHYMHEKGHIMQQAGAGPVRDQLEKLRSFVGISKPEEEFDLPYANRPQEHEADRLVNFLLNMVGWRGYGAEPTDPYNKLFRSTDEPTERGPLTMRSMRSR